MMAPAAAKRAAMMKMRTAITGATILNTQLVPRVLYACAIIMGEARAETAVCARLNLFMRMRRLYYTPVVIN